MDCVFISVTPENVSKASALLMNVPHSKPLFSSAILENLSLNVHSPERCALCGHRDLLFNKQHVEKVKTSEMERSHTNSFVTREAVLFSVKEANGSEAKH